MSLGVLKVGIAILLALAAFHFWQAIAYKPDYAALRDLGPKRNFEKVRVLGRVADIMVIRDAYSNSLVRIALQSDGAPQGRGKDESIMIKIEGEPANDFLQVKDPVRKGDLIEVAASLYAGDGFRHLSVSGPQFITVKERSTEAAAERGAWRPSSAPQEMAATVQELLSQPEKFKNKTVAVAGAEVAGVAVGVPVVRIIDPGKPGVELVVFGYEGPALASGQKVNVRGQFVFYEKKGYWEIKIRRGDDRAVVAVSDHSAR